MNSGRVVVVVPCFNEADRLDAQGFQPLADVGVEIVFVDDGSTDDTAGELDRLIVALPGSSVIHLPTNVGKAEAVRAGLRDGIDRGAGIVGYLDADLATPASEYLALLTHLGSPPPHPPSHSPSHPQSGPAEHDVVLGSRVALLGRRIERRMWRHYAGRVFATAASIALGLPVYDTQCGAKVFRVTPQLRAALSEPFSSRWSFDVELIGRLARGGAGVGPVSADAFIEIPLTTWTDRPGGKLRLPAAVRATADLPKIAWNIRHR